MAQELLFVHAMSPLHAGTGQGIGVIDLPIAREKATNLPYLPGSSLKGALRAACEDPKAKEKLFGPDTANASDFAGTLQFSDQSLLLLPVRSMAGTFAYLTCPWVLLRLGQDAKAIGRQDLPALPAAPKKDQIKVTLGSALKWNQTVVLEDLDLKADEDELLTRWAKWLGDRLFLGDADAAAALGSRLAVVHDDVFNYLAEQGTEVVARVKIQDDKKTVQKGGLWYEESLPAESVLYGMVLADSVRQRETVVPAAEALGEMRGMVQQLGVLQLGGKATVGRGICRLLWGGN